ncbi:DNA sulfur modification protein DndD [Paenibacillus sp. FSL W7-1287]|uniref:DNA sulfur modification protein DndD n=1 Tax=Paenibacillus sp. FSL W7-1287 TaxID=2954538 RepID=UPI0030F985AC
MKLTRLRLLNIGGYRGYYEFKLKPKNDTQKVILIGGKNGAGKTTFLDSVKIALFGSLSFGFKTETPIYYDKIKTKLNNTAQAFGESNYEILLDVQMRENFEKIEYTISRKWVLSDSNIKEISSVIRNKIELDRVDKELFFEKLREEFPPQLFEACLFDGEKISQMISEEVLSGYINKTSNILFNLDLFESLEQDLKHMLKQGNIKDELPEVENEIMDLEDKQRVVRDDIEYYNIQLAETNVQLYELKNQKDELLHQFDIHGGLFKEKRDALQNEIFQLEIDRKVMLESNKTDISQLLPMLLVRKELASVVSTLEKEEKNDAATKIKHSISAELIENVFADLKLDINRINGEQFVEALVTRLKPQISSPIHKASPDQVQEIHNLFNEIKHFDEKVITRRIDQNEVYLRKIRELKDTIEANDRASDLQEILESLNDVQKSIGLLELNLININEMIDECKVKDLEYADKLSQLNKEIIDNNKQKNIFTISNQLVSVSREFRYVQIRKKLQSVENELVKILNKLYRKKDFIKKVNINHGTYELTLFNNRGEKLIVEHLSAGEKQILFLSVIWAIKLTSNRELPFIFDTLLGRLDQTHKKAILESYIPQCSEQVIILSTDSEIDLEHYEILKPYIANEYTIEADLTNAKVQVSSNYFDMK